MGIKLKITFSIISIATLGYLYNLSVNSANYWDRKTASTKHRQDFQKDIKNEFPLLNSKYLKDFLAVSPFGTTIDYKIDVDHNFSDQDSLDQIQGLKGKNNRELLKNSSLKNLIKKLSLNYHNSSDAKNKITRNLYLNFIPHINNKKVKTREIASIVSVALPKSQAGNDRYDRVTKSVIPLSSDIFQYIEGAMILSFTPDEVTVNFRKYLNINHPQYAEVKIDSKMFNVRNSHFKSNILRGKFITTTDYLVRYNPLSNQYFPLSYQFYPGTILYNQDETQMNNSGKLLLRGNYNSENKSKDFKAMISQISFIDNKFYDFKVDIELRDASGNTSIDQRDQKFLTEMIKGKFKNKILKSLLFTSEVI